MRILWLRYTTVLICNINNEKRVNLPSWNFLETHKSSITCLDSDTTELKILFWESVKHRKLWSSMHLTPFWSFLKKKKRNRFNYIFGYIVYKGNLFTYFHQVPGAYTLHLNIIWSLIIELREWQKKLNFYKHFDIQKKRYVKV